MFLAENRAVARKAQSAAHHELRNGFHGFGRNRAEAPSRRGKIRLRVAKLPVERQSIPGIVRAVPRGRPRCGFPARSGEVAEWLKAHAWNACIGETLSRVRIPLSPPLHIFIMLKNIDYFYNEAN